MKLRMLPLLAGCRLTTTGTSGVLSGQLSSRRKNQNC
jgi:hypothetical protein